MPGTKIDDPIGEREGRPAPCASTQAAASRGLPSGCPRRERRAALFSTDFLAFSQAFVHQELVHHDRWHMEVFCRRRMNEDRFPYDHVHSLSPAPGVSGRLESALYGATTFSPSHLDRLNKGRFSLIHAQFGPGGVYGLTYKKLLGLPLIVTFGGYEVPLLQTSRRFNPKFWRYWLASGALFRAIDRFLPVSRDLGKRLIDLGAPPEKVRVHHRGIDIPETISPSRSSGSRGATVLMVGRFVEKKGFEHGLRACARLIRSGLDLKVEMIGRGPLRAAYDRIIEQDGIDERVEIRDSLPQREVFATMERADIMMVPSVIARNGDTEGTTNVLKEAMARALPSVITRHGGNADVIEHGRTGFVVEEKDEDGLAESIRRLALDPAMRVGMGEAARADALRRFSFEAAISALEDHYDEVAEMGGVKSKSS